MFKHAFPKIRLVPFVWELYRISFYRATLGLYSAFKWKPNQLRLTTSLSDDQLCIRNFILFYLNNWLLLNESAKWVPKMHNYSIKKSAVFLWLNKLNKPTIVGCFCMSVQYDNNYLWLLNTFKTGTILFEFAYMYAYQNLNF